MRRSRGLAATAVLLVLGCCACGSAVDGGPSDAPPYRGELTEGAAVDALECAGDVPYSRARGRYDDGLAKVASSPQEAFDDYVDYPGVSYSIPGDGYRIERADERRALISYDVEDRTKVAVVMAAGIRDWRDEVGWGIVAWAQCDPSEFPAAVSDDLGIGVWEDASGRRLPVTRVRSFTGPEHCSWTGITFLLIGPDERRAEWFVRDPGGELAPLLRGEYARRAALPAGALELGWRRDGRRLWLGPEREAAYLVEVEDPGDVERWPAAKRPILCA